MGSTDALASIEAAPDRLIYDVQSFQYLLFSEIRTDVHTSSI
jgi:hypothetical protein